MSEDKIPKFIIIKRPLNYIWSFFKNTKYYGVNFKNDDLELVCSSSKLTKNSMIKLIIKRKYKLTFKITNLEETINEKNYIFN